MALITIKYGAIADSVTLNSNFKYLDKRADDSTFQKYGPEVTYKRGDHVTLVKDGFLYCFQSKQDNNTNHPLEDTFWWEKVSISSGNGFNLFDTKLSDRVLEGVEALGWALQGTFVYKTALSGSRIGYPDFYNRCIKEKSESVASQVDLGGSVVTIYRNENGHQFFDIKDKEVIDKWFDTFGIADFYGIDISSERIMLPRNRYYTQLTTNIDNLNKTHKSTITDILEGGKHSHTKGSLSLKGSFPYYSLVFEGEPTGCFTRTKHGIGNPGGGGNGLWGTVFLDASNIEGSTSEDGEHKHTYKDTDIGAAITPPSAYKFLYYCVGNTIQDTSWINIAEQVANGIKEIDDSKNAALTSIEESKTSIETLTTDSLKNLNNQTSLSVNNVYKQEVESIKNVENSSTGIVEKIEQDTAHITVDFNANAEQKTNEYNVNALTLLSRYDNNDLARTKAFNDNALEKQTLVDASSEIARKAANGTIEEYPEGSSKYWSDKAKDIVVNGVIDDNVIATDKTYSSSKIEETFGKGSGSGHMVGELVPFPVSTKYTPEGFIKPDGTEFTEGLFPDLYREYLTDHRWFDRSKIEVVGSPTITDDGIASGFSNSNKIQHNFSNLNNKKVDIYITFKTGDISSMTTAEENILAREEYAFLIKLVKSNSSISLAYNDANGQASVASFLNIDSNKTYTLHYTSDGTKHISVLQGENYDKTLVKTLEVIHLLDGLYSFGSRKSGNYAFTGSIDLKQFSISVDGKEVYSPTANTLDTCTYEEYANEVNTYGACPKFAVDDVRKTFKIPLMPDGYYIKKGQGTANKAGLPNIKGVIATRMPWVWANENGALKLQTEKQDFVVGTMSQDVGTLVSLDASKSNPIYGKTTDTVETNAVAVQWFVYVANGQVGESAIDWSRYNEGLQGKANADGNNFTKNGKATITNWCEPDLTAGIAITLPYEVTKCGYLKLNGYKGGNLYINNIMIESNDNLYNYGRFIFIPRGTLTSGYVTGRFDLTFYPLKGVSND